ncbi:HHIP-like protein 1 isoform X2 [Dreissena polymorpha]|uniref:HHIP-like protein 1 isoform X2 n=1 Tax=Dreissena polymorpha TaxID=45954 RepID=UPI002264A1B4|nr:HHIP-like protein 1 isoform X2 [Dreissena polymorpha]XP_052272914.1 HHIP-like protein 1 isoform X2 [Dreissena polymorpha]
MTSGTRDEYKRYVLLLFFVVTQLMVAKLGVNGHPQCLDARPPFRASSVSFCPAYKDHGCCTPHQDKQLKIRYDRIRLLVPASEKQLWTDCENYVKTFLCEECSPYAAHIFDAEQISYGTVPKPRAFPGLCRGYCGEFFTKCKNIVKYYMNEVGSDYMEEASKLQSAITMGEENFCNETKLVDLDYCYPGLLTNPILIGNISIDKVSQEGCLCMEPFDKVKFRNPIFLKHANDGSKRMFIGEQIGIVHIMYPDGRLITPAFLDISADIQSSSYKGDERGMLGMAFHPNFSQNRKFYIYYSAIITEYEQQQTSADHKTRIEEFQVSADKPDQVDYSYHRIILEVYEPYWNHNGGEILFGDDGYMYLFIGDGGQAGDPLNSGQDMFSLLGKVVRIDVDRADTVRQREYSIPPDNPFADEIKGLPEIYAYGIRNIWRCGKDRGDHSTGEGKGRIVCGDVGQSNREEVNLIEKGANYGWKIKEGNADYCKKCKSAFLNETLTAPIYDYGHSVGKSVTGGHFYRGCQSPNLNGFYIYGDFMSGRLFRLLHRPGNNTWHNKELKMCGADYCRPPLVNDYSTSIISFGEDEDGEMYMLSTSFASATKASGTVYRIVDPHRRGNPIDCIPYQHQQTLPPASSKAASPTQFPTPPPTDPLSPLPTQPPTANIPLINKPVASAPVSTQSPLAKRKNRKCKKRRKGGRLRTIC